jgi:hypothetical protein
MEDQIEFAEVKFYFNVLIGGTQRTLALVCNYLQHDPLLFKNSFCTVWSMTSLGDEGLQIIDVKSILAVISVQPHDHHVEAGDTRFFVWEKSGLDIGVLGGVEEELIDE